MTETGELDKLLGKRAPETKIMDEKGALNSEFEAVQTGSKVTTKTTSWYDTKLEISRRAQKTKDPHELTVGTNSSGADPGTQRRTARIKNTKKGVYLN